MNLTDDQIKDLALSTQKELGKLKFNQIAQKLQHYDVMGKIMKKDKVQFDSGNGIQRNIMVDNSGAARNTGLYAKDAVNVADVMKQMNIPWRHTTTNYAFERREMAMNRGASRIVNLMKVRRTDAFLALIELMEKNFWGAPVDSQDTLTPFGVRYWLNKNAAVGGNGVSYAGFDSDCPDYEANGPGGLSHPKWHNFTGQYASVSKNSLVALMRRTHRMIKFESPVDVPDYRKGKGQQYRIYTDLATVEAIEKIGESQNENLGRDLAPYDDSMTFRRHPIVWCPQLDPDNENEGEPVNVEGDIYFINFAWFYPVFLKGEYLREAEPKLAPDQHTVFVNHIDLTWNILCTDLRRQAVLWKAPA
ncbi:MAG: phage major capsid protein [Sedimentisphaerales bacterium]|nr:phage major capsid protein [Sedimentisphaerales bacterium]